MKILNHYELDALKEVLNIGIGKAADSLSKLTSKKIFLEIPELCSGSSSDLKEQIINILGNWTLNVSQSFNGELSGDALFVLDEVSGLELINSLCENCLDFSNKFTETDTMTLTEIGNILISSCLGTINNIIDENERLKWELPVCNKQGVEELVNNFLNDGTFHSEEILVGKLSIASNNFSGCMLLLIRFDSLENIRTIIKI